MVGRIRVFACLLLAIVGTPSFASGPVIVDEQNRSPYMVGIPPTRLVDSHLSWATDPEKSSWAFQNVSSIMRVEMISRGTGPVLPLPYADGHLLDESFIGVGGAEAPLREILGDLRTDGFIANKNGQVVIEAYFNGLTPDRRHVVFSVTKSLIGSLFGTLVEQDGINPADPVVKYLPELMDSGFATASVQQVLDMTTHVFWNHDRSDPYSSVNINSIAGGFSTLPIEVNHKNTLEFLQTLDQVGPHGERLTYNPTNTEILGWIISRHLNRNWQAVFADRIWSKIGAEKDAYVAVDGQGHGFATAGFNATLRDLARVGLLLKNEGTLNGQQIVPQSWIRDTVAGNAEVRAAWEASQEQAKHGDIEFYHNQFRVLNSGDGEYVARGHAGQVIYVNRKRDLVGVFVATLHQRERRALQIELLRQIGSKLSTQSD